MADRIETYTVTIASGTLESAPATVLTTFKPGIVDQIDIIVPPGPSGLMGFRFTYGDVVVIPHDESSWLIWDDVRRSFTVQDYPEGSFWSIEGYNTDIYDHSIYVDYHVSEYTPKANAPVSGAILPQPAPIVITSQG